MARRYGGRRPCASEDVPIFWTAGLAARRLDESEPDGLDARLGARAGAELAEDRRDVMVHGPLRDDEALRDVHVAETLGDEREHFHLARRELGWVPARGGPRPAGQPLAEPARDGGRRR